VGRQEVQAVAVGFVVSVSIVILASVGGEWAMRDEVTVSGEDMEWNQERGRPFWLTDYTRHVPIIGYLYSPADYSPHHVTLSQWEALMHSLSPGVRARYEGVVLEREEARHAAFANERLRWMRARASGK
jgi:hypothetical protein